MDAEEVGSFTNHHRFRTQHPVGGSLDSRRVTSHGKLLAGVTIAGFALDLVLVMQRNSRRAFAATSRLSEKLLGSRVSGVGEFRNLDAERVLKDNVANGLGGHGK
jgi:hypothetical protein